jgi:hypothetical protein
MVNANLYRRLWLLLVWPCLTLVADSVLAAQVCKYDSIVATAPASRFTDNGNGTVTDQATGLQWKRCSEGQTWSDRSCTGTASTPTWQQALQRADTASYAGRDDWRLPNINELKSIVEEACYDPTIDLAVFPATPSSGYWSSSPYADHTYPSAWSLSFNYGNDEYGYNGNAFQVRLVRGGR